MRSARSRRSATASRRTATSPPTRNQETWERRSFEKSQGDSRQAALDPRATERFRLQHPEAYKRWEAGEKRNVDALYQGSLPQAQDRADAIADERRRQDATLGARSKTLLTSKPQTETRRRAEDSIVDAGVKEREYTNANLDVVSFGVHDSSRRGQGLESVANLCTFGGGTSARNAGQAGGQAVEEHKQGDQLNVMGSHLDAQKMHQSASEHTATAALESTMTVVSAAGAGSLYTGVAKEVAAARFTAQRQAIIADMKAYPSERITVRAAEPSPSVGTAGSEAGAVKRTSRVSPSSAARPSAPSTSGPSGAPQISAQKQAGHIKGTPQYNNRVKAGKPTSAFDDEESAVRYTQEAWEKGTDVKGRPGVRDYEVGTRIGSGPQGGAQTRVRVHQDAAAKIHGHPCGPEKQEGSR